MSTSFSSSVDISSRLAPQTNHIYFKCISTSGTIVAALINLSQKLCQTIRICFKGRRNHQLVQGRYAVNSLLHYIHNWKSHSLYGYRSATAYFNDQRKPNEENQVKSIWLWYFFKLGVFRGPSHKECFRLPQVVNFMVTLPELIHRETGKSKSRVLHVNSSARRRLTRLQECHT